MILEKACNSSLGFPSFQMMMKLYMYLTGCAMNIFPLHSSGAQTVTVQTWWDSKTSPGRISETVKAVYNNMNIFTLQSAGAYSSHRLEPRPHQGRYLKQWKTGVCDYMKIFTLQSFEACSLQLSSSGSKSIWLHVHDTDFTTIPVLAQSDWGWEICRMLPDGQGLEISSEGGMATSYMLWA